MSVVGYTMMYAFLAYFFIVISLSNREYCQGIHVGFEKLIFWP